MNEETTPGSPFSKARPLSGFQSSLCDWFDRVGEEYPWRGTRDPYAILVSELMLQQTQIATVLGRGYYTRWMKLFPDWQSLAEAEEGQILKAWEGLGYYNRARNLQKAAVEVSRSLGGVCPSNPVELEALPGVGRYTAGAVSSFAFGNRAPIVDGNVARVLARLFDYREPVDAPPGLKQLWKWADEMTPGDRVESYNSGIMELGQRICTKSAPSCKDCPVCDWCLGNKSGGVECLPAKKAKVKTTRRDEIVGLLIDRGRIFLEQESGTRRKGLWRLPELSKEESGDFEELFRFDYAITRYRVTLKVMRPPRPAIEKMAALKPGEWYDLGDEAGFPALGSPYRKAILKYQNSHEDLMTNESNKRQIS